MGQLVFQATLGGAVNLVGPNTASTFNLNVPAVASTIATLAAQTFAGTQTFTVDAVVNGLTVGRGAGAVATNTAVGASALATNSTGTNSTAVGRLALTTNSTGANLTAVGAEALKLTTVGNNTAVGAAALFTNSSGQYNVAVGQHDASGYPTLYSNTTGSNNTGIGSGALAQNNTASNNTAVGYQAGYSNQTGARNTIIGYLAGYNLTGSFNTLVGSGTSSSAGDQITSGTKNTVLGAYNGNQGGLDIRTLSNYVVLSDGDGNCPIFTGNNLTVSLQGAGSFSGTGITFPATQSASSNANTLDDYEEGTWTPAFGTSGTAFTSVTYTGQDGTYTKVGRLVTASMRISISARTIGSASGDLLITGLPFTSNNTFGYWTGSVLTNSTATNQPSVVRVLGNSTSVDLFYYSAAVGTTNVPATSLSATAEIRLQVSYIV